MTAWWWPMGTVIEECKRELGLDPYRVRGWVGWHHHTTMTMLAHPLLVRLRVKRGMEAPALPELARIQRQNHAAFRVHKKYRRRAGKSPPAN